MPNDKFCVKPLSRIRIKLQWLLDVIFLWRHAQWFTEVSLRPAPCVAQVSTLPQEDPDCAPLKATVAAAVLHYSPLLQVSLTFCILIWKCAATRRFAEAGTLAELCMRLLYAAAEQGQRELAPSEVGPPMQSTWPLLWTHRRSTCSQSSQ